MDETVTMKWGINSQGILRIYFENKNESYYLSVSRL
jgi:hypothetical protein